MVEMHIHTVNTADLYYLLYEAREFCRILNTNNNNKYKEIHLYKRKKIRGAVNHEPPLITSGCN